MKAITSGIPIALAALLVGTAYSVRFSPDQLSLLTYAWFVFPYLWIAVLAICLLLIVFRKTWTSIFCIAMMTWTAPKFLSVFSPIQTSERKEVQNSQSLKILTYNVCFFGMGEMRQQRTAAFDSLASYIEEEKADIICFQEGTQENIFAKIISSYPNFRKAIEPYSHRLFSQRGQADFQYILSKYPLRNVQPCDALDSNDEATKIGSFLIADVTVPWGGSIRLFNCHLKSIGLSSSQITSVSEGGLTEQRAKTLKSTLGQMMEAFKIRQHEVELLSQAISNTRGTVVVCGDFNDTPISYTYETLSKTQNADGLSLEDAFAGSGFGLGDTYRGKLPPIRIDYVLASEDLRLSAYGEHDKPISDHCYVTATVSPKK